ncbi:hypothetical protein PSAC2689_180062 [Paraburkholderia sacchari]
MHSINVRHVPMRLSMSVSAIAPPHAGEIASTHTSGTDRLMVHQLSHAFRTADAIGERTRTRAWRCAASSPTT